MCHKTIRHVIPKSRVYTTIHIKYDECSTISHGGPYLYIIPQQPLPCIKVDQPSYPWTTSTIIKAYLCKARVEGLLVTHAQNNNTKLVSYSHKRTQDMPKSIVSLERPPIPNPQLSLGSGHIGKFYQEDTAAAQFPILIHSSRLTFIKQEDTGKEKTC